MLDDLIIEIEVSPVIIIDEDFTFKDGKRFGTFWRFYGISKHNNFIEYIIKRKLKIKSCDI